MKRIIAVISLLIMILVLAACEKGGEAEYVQSNPGTANNSPIMKGDGGYYYNASTLSKLALRYYDIKTGKTIFLCSKPECSHDGNIYCTATSEKYHALGTGYYENELYIAVLEHTDSEILYKLLRASKDGTELAEISTFAKMATDTSGLLTTISAGLVIHKGKAYFPYEYVGDETETISGIAEIDIATGRSHSIIEGAEHGQFFNVTAAGNMVYFMTMSSDFSSNIFEYDISEKHLECIVTVPAKDGILGSGTVINGKYWYTLTKSDGENVIKIYDPIAKETADSDLDYGDLQPVGISSDGKYLFISDGKLTNSLKENARIAICSLEGEKLTEFEIPSHSTYSEYSVNILDGTVYLQYYDSVVCCSLENILNETPVWEEIFCFERGEDNNA